MAKKPQKDLSSLVLGGGASAADNVQSIKPVVRQGGIAVTDPAIEMPMKLTLSQMKSFDGNPRVEKNRKYDEIKESIRHSGLKQKLIVTRKPPELRDGDDRFMISDGGNTRLSILNELYEETGDKRFFEHDVVFRPWVNEKHILVNHMIENDLRDDTILIDRANAVQRLIDYILAEWPEDVKQTDTVLVDKVKKEGYSSLSPRLLRRFRNAIRYSQFIPIALRNGMGGPQVDAIRALEKKVEELLAEHEQEQFLPTTFGEVLARYDDESFNLKDEKFLDDLVTVIADQCGIETAKAGAKIAGKVTQTTVTQAGQNPTGPTTDGTGSSSSGNDHSSGKDKTQSASASASDRSTSKDKPQSPSPTLPNNADALRRHLHECAMSIAQAVGIEHLVFKLPTGLGFAVDIAEADLSEEQQWAWGMLFTLSDVLTDPRRHIALPRAMVVKGLLSTGDIGRVLDALEGMEPEWLYLGRYVFHVDQATANHLNQLFKTGRQLMDYLSESGDKLWDL